MTATSGCHGNYIHYVMFITSITRLASSATPRVPLAVIMIDQCVPNRIVICNMTASRYGLDSRMVVYIIRLTLMKRPETSSTWILWERTASRRRPAFSLENTWLRRCAAGE